MSVLKRLVVIATVAAAVAAVGGLTASAQEPASRVTKITFSKPVRLPGVTLPAGTYSFLHPTPMEDYHVLQVMNENRTESYGFFLTIPNIRMTASEETVVTFRETPVGYIDTVRAWFYPGETIGDEFVYSRKEAGEITKAIHQPVLTLPQPNRGESKKAQDSKKK